MKTVAELTVEINNLLNFRPAETVADSEAQKLELATNLASIIDAYIQDQIGERLKLLPTAIACPAPAGVPVATPGFLTLTRTV
jgi:hypothetical protein